MTRKVLFVLFVLLLPAPGFALNRCTQSATGSCATRHDTIQQAVDAATGNDAIVIGPGVYVEDVYVFAKKALTIFQAGSLLVGATPGGIAWHSEASPVKHEMRNPVIQVAPGGVGIKATGGWVFVNKGSVTCDGTGTGILLSGGVDHTPRRVTVSHCGIGIDIDRVRGHYINANKVNDSGIGIRVIYGTQGQVFFNVVHGSAIGIESIAAHHTDINSNDLFCDGVVECIGFHAPVPAAPSPVTGLRVNNLIEYGLNEHFGYQGRHYQIQKCDLTYTNDPRLSPEMTIEYGSNKADGVPLLKYKVRGPGCP